MSEYKYVPVVPNDKQSHPFETATTPCNMGVGCESAGVCYAEANGDPGQCGRNSDPPSDSRTEFSDTEMLDWVIKSECAVINLGYGEYGIYSTDPDNGGQLLINQSSHREAIKAAIVRTGGEIMYNFEGAIVGFMIVCGLVGAAIMAFLLLGVPWLWEIVKPFIHGWTA